LDPLIEERLIFITVANTRETRTSSASGMSTSL
jgi:hypothetical protein